MMNSVWQQLTLTNLPLYQWKKASYLHELVGALRTWRQGSWLMQWADPIGVLLIIVVFGLAPFVSTTLIGLLLLACAAYWLLLTLSDDDSTVGLSPIHLLVGLYWGISVIATALSPVKSAALEGLIKLTLNLLWFALIARVLRSPRLRSLAITCYILVTLIVSVGGLRQWFFGAAALATWVDTESSLAGTTRVYSFLGNPNLLAAYLLPAVAFSGAALFIWQGWGPRILALLALTLNSACLVLTFSRGGWIGFVVDGFVLVALSIHWWSIYLPRFWRTWALPIVLGISAALIVVAVATVSPLRDRVFSIFEGRQDSSNNFRLNVWTSVVQMIRDRPFLGIGPGNTAFNSIYPRYQRAGFTALSAYSVFLEIAVETGVIGLACFVWLLIVTVNQGWMHLQHYRRQADRQGIWLMGAIASMAGLLAHGLVDTVWYRPQVSTLWWLTMAVIASYYTVHPTMSENSETHP